MNSEKSPFRISIFFHNMAYTKKSVPFSVLEDSGISKGFPADAAHVQFILGRLCCAVTEFASRNHLLDPKVDPLRGNDFMEETTRDGSIIRPPNVPC
jgi:hypothetical protein